MNERHNEPWWAVIGPGEGESLWQPLPSRGYVDLKLTPENTPYDGFTSGTQLLPPGCHIREHGHRRNHELIFVHKGSGRVEIEGKEYPITAGSTVLFGPGTRAMSWRTPAMRTWSCSGSFCRRDWNTGFVASAGNGKGASRCPRRSRARRVSKNSWSGCALFARPIETGKARNSRP